MTDSSIPEETVDTTINLARLVFQFGRTYRSTYHEDGVTQESDTDHTVMLGTIACAYAARFAPELDLGKISQFALVHDLVEVYAQDTPTLRLINDDEKKAKDEREQKSLERIEKEFGSEFPWITETINAYESKASPEARFIKVLDKAMPKITHILNKGVTVREQGQEAEIRKRYEHQKEEMLSSYGADQPHAIALWQKLVDRMIALLIK